MKCAIFTHYYLVKVLVQHALALMHSKATKSYKGESRKCLKSNYVMGTKLLHGQLHPSGVLYVDSELWCGRSPVQIQGIGGSSFLTLFFEEIVYHRNQMRRLGLEEMQIVKIILYNVYTIYTLYNVCTSKMSLRHYILTSS